MSLLNKKQSQPTSEWAGMDGDLALYISEESSRTLKSYRAQPNRIAEDANVEHDTAYGGYQHRQLFELVQNSADALWQSAPAEEASDDRQLPSRGQIRVHLTKDFLYCADNGEPIDSNGVTALMFSHLSPKRSTNQIGTFGLGFKAVLGVSDSPEFFSRSGSFRFDRANSRERIRAVVPDAADCPALRLPEPIDPEECWNQDDTLCELMGWAGNIVRLPLRPGAHDDLLQQLIEFPTEFLLFVPHVEALAITDDSGEINRVLELESVDNEYLLADSGVISQWKLFQVSHVLSNDARVDLGHGDSREEVPIWWAAPVDQLARPGHFWAFFPTSTPSLVPGILNAPWKTNQDRQNLLSGVYNEELIEAASHLIAEALTQLSTEEDPARHLDALPRRHEASDPEQADLLRAHLFDSLRGRPIVPDQDGKLRGTREISYPPQQLTKDRSIDLAPFDRWAALPTRPRGWLHHKSLSRTRLAAVDRLFQRPDETSWRVSSAPRASIAHWLEALVQQSSPDSMIAASATAIQVTSLIPQDTLAGIGKGEIVLTASGSWRTPDPDVLFLPDAAQSAASVMDPEHCVHPELASDGETLAALKALGIRLPSTESRFGLVAERAFANSDQKTSVDSLFESFWAIARSLDVATAISIIHEHKYWPRRLRCRVRTGRWRPIHAILMPGAIVPGDGSRDDGVTVDMDFHERDLALLRELGISDAPVSGRNLVLEPEFERFLTLYRKQYRQRGDLPSRPFEKYLAFTSTEGIGPLTILAGLSDEGRALFTDALMNQDATYEPWEMWHTGTNRNTYPRVPFESPMAFAIRNHGLVRTAGGMVAFADALGPEPKNPMALYALLQHPNSEKIKQAFELSEPTPEFNGEGDPAPLTDIWPGMQEHLPAHLKECRLTLCQGIRVAGAERNCIFYATDIYLVGNVEDDERTALERVAEALGLDLMQREIEEILARRTPREIEERRAAIRRLSTDAERLLAAVGEEALRSGLQQSLLNALSVDQRALTGIDFADAAIATFHTGALKQFKWALDDLAPPSQWAGSRRAVSFVRSLGFSEEWAGERNSGRPAFLEVEGPLSLPPLHNFQDVVVQNVRDMFRSAGAEGVVKRGMLTMPTGSGKTRVAVQAIVEAMRQGEFRGGVLWVADRDELCEQAVEAWAQAWRSLGSDAEQLRISRMWSGQPAPSPTTDGHVVVATIQTLSARLTSRRAEYGFLKDFKLVIFDEAHRSIAPTYTSVLTEMGLTYRQSEDEPFLLGLTATPYRGRDKEETTRLVSRYGGNRLDAGAFSSDDPRVVVSELQAMGVLALVDQVPIEGGTFRLTESEREEVSKFAKDPERLEHLLAWLPQSVENRIAQDSHRTKRIIDAYEIHVKPNWPTLIFATSVEHAQTLAALLSRRGITARSVSGTTETVIRRRIIEGFRHGEIDVLVNYGVLREGFDAPKTRAIIVARPVYSPNLYFQMIGRGLRGHRNGGHDRCLILNVRDNIEEFGAELSFQDLEWLWDR
ncbi:MAG: DEAD/DEAH box helicase [bacterium]|nr:DEAD/DEAH box helicase [bacterium]